MSETIEYLRPTECDILGEFQLTDDERQEFDWMSEDELDSSEFFRYDGNVYNLGEFMTVPTGLFPPLVQTDEEGEKTTTHWDGYASDSFFSGVVVRFHEDYVIAAVYVS